MTTISYSDSTYPIRPDFAEVHNRFRESLARPGAWWTGARAGCDCARGAGRAGLRSLPGGQGGALTGRGHRASRSGLRPAGCGGGNGAPHRHRRGPPHPLVVPAAPRFRAHRRPLRGDRRHRGRARERRFVLSRDGPPATSPSRTRCRRAERLPPGTPRDRRRVGADGAVRERGERWRRICGTPVAPTM